jgi:adenylate cyclase
MVWVINNIPPLVSVVVPLGMLITYYFVARTLQSFGITLDIFYSYYYGWAVYVVSFGYNLLYFDKERQKIKGMFEHYLAPEYINKVTDNPKNLKLGGEEREMTVLFSDIRAFSTLSEKLSPQELVSLLNEFLTPMTNIIMENHGIVDKYIGDAIMAFWGAPIEDPKHPENAVRSGLQMLEKLNELNKTLKNPIRIGIGINTDQMVVGNMGSEKRFNYTVMGDGVNLASRLEGLTKHYGVPFVITEETQNRVKDSFATRLLDLVAVKGKKNPVKIYQVLGEIEKENELGNLIARTNEALEAYFAQKWTPAEKAFRLLNRIDPYKGYSENFLERIKLLRKAPPGKGWSGAWEMHEK